LTAPPSGESAHRRGGKLMGKKTEDFVKTSLPRYKPKNKTADSIKASPSAVAKTKSESTTKVIVQTPKGRVILRIPHIPDYEIRDAVTRGILRNGASAIEKIAVSRHAKIKLSELKRDFVITEIFDGEHLPKLEAVILSVDSVNEIVSCRMDGTPRVNDKWKQGEFVEVYFFAVTAYANPNDVQTSSPTT
jgi:hypothetical protein